MFVCVYVCPRGVLNCIFHTWLPQKCHIACACLQWDIASSPEWNVINFFIPLILVKDHSVMALASKLQWKSHSASYGFNSWLARQLLSLVSWEPWDCSETIICEMLKPRGEMLEDEILFCELKWGHKTWSHQTVREDILQLCPLIPVTHANKTWSRAKPN